MRLGVAVGGQRHPCHDITLTDSRFPPNLCPDVAGAVNNAKAGHVRYRTDKNGIIHGGIGKVSFEPAAIKTNLEALIADHKKAKPSSAKGQYLKKVTLSTTMGPGLAIDLSSLEV